MGQSGRNVAVTTIRGALLSSWSTSTSTFTVLAAATGLVLVIVPAGATMAFSPTGGAACGAVVTSDLTLGRDLVCPDGAGLVVRGDVTIDLAGHAIVGPGATATDGVAVSVDDASEVTVVGGTLTGWPVAVRARDEDRELRPTVRLRRVVLKDGARGVQAGWRSTVDVDRSRFEGLRTAVFADNAAMTVTGSVFVDDERAVEGSQGALVRIERTRFEGGATAVSCSDARCELTGNTFRGATVAVSTWYGHGALTRNVFVDNESAVYLSWESELTVEANVFRGNGTGVVSGVLDASVVRRNDFTRNGTGIMTQVQDDDIGTFTTYEQNRVTRNGDGILASQPGVRLRGNTALRNDGWGINVVGAVDLGGNVARGNGREPQCVGVTCDRSGAS